MKPYFLEGIRASVNQKIRNQDYFRGGESSSAIEFAELACDGGCGWQGGSKCRRLAWRVSKVESTSQTQKLLFCRLHSMHSSF